MKQFAYDAFDEACAPVAPWSSCRCGCDSGGGCDAAGADTGVWNRSVSSGECPCASGVVETCGKSVDNGTLSLADCGMDANGKRGALPGAGESGSGGGDGVAWRVGRTNVSVPAGGLGRRLRLEAGPPAANSDREGSSSSVANEDR